MAIHDIRSLKTLAQERQRLQQEHDMAMANIKENANTEYEQVKTKAYFMTDKVTQGIQGANNLFNQEASSWKLPLLGSIGALLGILLVKWFTADNPEEEDSRTNEVVGANAHPPQSGEGHLEEHQLEDRIKAAVTAAIAEFEVEKKEEQPSIMASLLSSLGTLLLKELMKSGKVGQILQLIIASKSEDQAVTTPLEQE